MVRGYRQDEIQQKLIDLLSKSKTGLSGVEIAEKLEINRATITKYLNVFAMSGIIKQKSIGNANLWFIESDTENLQFPQDYFHVKEKFIELLTSGLQHKAYDLIKNARQSGADTRTLLMEVMVPAIDSVEDMYLKAKIGKSEVKLFHGVILNSIRIVSLANPSPQPKKNAVALSSDSVGAMYGSVASCALGYNGWQVFELGNMSDAIDVMYDLDLQKLLTRVWKQKPGIMVVLVFSASGEGAKFFSESVSALKAKFGKHLHIALHSKSMQISETKAEFVSDSFDAVLQWTDSMAGTIS